MRELIGPEVDLDDVNRHAALLIITYDLLRDQAQVRKILRANAKGLVFDLKQNLKPSQCDELIVNVLNRALPGYEAKADYKLRELSVMRRAENKAAKKPSRPAEKSAA